MKLQQWGTYSVRDHLRPRPFVADVLLFDKLVIPRPVTEKEIHTALENRLHEDQKELWRRMNWDPDRQRALLDILGEFDLAIELPWGNQEQLDWQKIVNGALECDRSDLTQYVEFQVKLAKNEIPEEAAYLSTAGLLSLYASCMVRNDAARKLFNSAKVPGVPVEPVIAYGAYAEFTRDQEIQQLEDQAKIASVTPYAMFGWEFFVPEDSDKSDTQLLRKAAKLASQPDFCEARQYFHGWLKQMYEGGTDRQDAYEQMLKMLSEYTKIMKKAGFATAMRN